MQDEEDIELHRLPGGSQGTGSDTHAQGLESFIQQSCPVISGNESRRRLPHGTWQESYQAYIESIGPHYSTYCYKTWAEKMKEHHIRTPRYDKYGCPTCSAWSNTSNPTPELQILHEQHLETVKKQRSAYQQDLESIDPETLVIVYDYARLHEMTSEKHSVLCFCIYRKEANATEHSHEYYDYFSRRRQQSDYIKDALASLQIQGVFDNKKTIKVWSDNGLKNYGVFNAWHSLFPEQLIDPNNVQQGSNQLQRIVVNFYAPRHGHNVCDGHFGALKKKIRTDFAAVVMGGTEDLYTWLSRTQAPGNRYRLDDNNVALKPGRKWKTDLRTHLSFTIFPSRQVELRYLSSDEYGGREELAPMIPG